MEMPRSLAEHINSSEDEWDIGSVITEREMEELHIVLWQDGVDMDEVVDEINDGLQVYNGANWQHDIDRYIKVKDDRI